MSTLEIRKLRALGRQIASVATRDIALLDAIEKTIDGLDDMALQFRQMNLVAAQLLDTFSKASPHMDNGICGVSELLVRARDSVAAIHDHFRKKQLSAIADKLLSDDDGVLEAYDCFLRELAELHNCLNSLAWQIGEDEAEVSPTMPEVFGTAEDLFTAMGV